MSCGGGVGCGQVVGEGLGVATTLLVVGRGWVWPKFFSYVDNCRFLFWSDWGSRPQIRRANLDGTHVVPIVTDHIMRPHGLALDFDLGRLYWCDAFLDTIEHTDLYGR